MYGHELNPLLKETFHERDQTRVEYPLCSCIATNYTLCSLFHTRVETEPDGALKQLTFHSENSPDVWDIVRAINVVKTTLKAIDDEYYDHIIGPDIDPNAHEKTDNKVFEQLQSAENIIHPGDY